MSASALDPLIHNPERLRVVATLAALPGGDALASPPAVTNVRAACCHRRLKRG